MIINLDLPTSVVFGRGRLGELGRRTQPFGTSALLVCGRGAVRRHGILDGALKSLADAGITATVFDAVLPEPTATEADLAVEAALRAGCDVIIGIGGGSAIDTAKAVAAGMRLGPVGPLVGRTLDRIPGPVPVVAVPTTAGSGAEMTRGAILTDPRRGLKSGIRGDDLFPRLALVDPLLARSVPAAVAADTAFDALAHAVEGYVARRSDDFTRWCAGRALELLARRRDAILRTPDDPATRDDLAFAALLGGIVVANASTCLPHRLQQAMGGLGVPISHGRGLAALYPVWLRHARPHAGERFAEIAARLGGGDVHDLVDRFRGAVGVTGGLRASGIGDGHVDAILAAVSGNLDNDPIPEIDEGRLRAIVREAL
ncbi:iron-containing alcohol dehydrogenase [Actinoplanes sp. NPDC023714]|uniref:iron-containing alcohol dehydrogenase n=1 Tax=Actinoplanes sp. NPDC023714 TaxID=3154322 RepID=UPI0033E3A582